MRDADGAGLAAPQVYESVQLVVIEVGQNSRYPSVQPILGTASFRSSFLRIPIQPDQLHPKIIARPNRDRQHFRLQHRRIAIQLLNLRHWRRILPRLHR